MGRESLEVEERISKIKVWILSSEDWLSTEDLLGLRAFNHLSNDQLDEWRTDKKIFGVVYEDIQYYPLYAFDVGCTVRPVPGLQAILNEFDGRKSEWGIVFWFEALNGFLGGRYPMDFLRVNPEFVLEAVRDELLGIQHG